MSAVAFAEQNTLGSPDIDSAIVSAAETHGIHLDSGRMLELQGRTTNVQQLDERMRSYPDERQPENIFGNMDGLTVSRATFSQEFGTTAARIDFTPIA